MDVQVIGVCRFSLLVEGGFQDGPTDIEERARFLFDPRRLAIRFAWFEHVLAPSIRAQEDDRFSFVVLASDRLPRPHADRLHDIARTVPGMEVELAPVGAHHRVANEAIRRRIDCAADLLAQFRLDDDDGLARDYVARVRSDLEGGLANLALRYGALSCDYLHGLVLEADAASARLRQTYVRAWTCGQTLYQRPDARQLLFGFGHHRHHSDMPTVSLQDSLMFVRGRHPTNDSPLRVARHDTRRARMAVLTDRFGVSIDALQAALRAAEAEG